MRTVLVSDDRHQVRDAIIGEVAAVPGVVRVEGVPHARVVACYARQPSDLVLVATQPVAAPGVHAAIQLLTAYPAATVLLFGPACDADSAAPAIAAGARGYLHWGMIRAGWNPALALLAAPLKALRGAAVEFSEPELQVLRAMSQGKSTPAIGRELSLSEATVKTYTRRLFWKLGVNDRVQAVARGFQLGLLS